MKKVNIFVLLTGKLATLAIRYDWKKFKSWFEHNSNCFVKRDQCYWGIVVWTDKTLKYPHVWLC